MTRLEQALDALNSLAGNVEHATRRRRRRKRINRDQLIAAVKVGGAVMQAVGSLFPKAAPFVGAFGTLTQEAPALIPKEEQDLLTRLQVVQQQLDRVPTENGGTRERLEAQQELLLDMVEAEEQKR
jgi:hypothetical protein